MGFIYIISSTATDKKYIGQTTQPLGARWYDHKQSAQRYVKYIDTDPEAIASIRFSVLYRAMAKYGFETFNMDALVEAPDEELNDLEVKYIAEYDTIAPAGYNLASGGGNFAHSPQTIERMKEQKKANVENNRHEKLRGMPMYVSYIPPSRGEGIRVVGHPLCRHKNFRIKDYGSFEAVRDAVCKFIEELEKSGIPYNGGRKPYTRKAKPEIALAAADPIDTIETAPPADDKPITFPPALTYPTRENHKGIIRSKNGYKVQKQYKGVKYFKSFDDKRFTDEQNWEAAFAYLTRVIDQLRNDHCTALGLQSPTQNNVQRLNVGGFGNDDAVDRIIGNVTELKL